MQYPFREGNPFFQAALRGDVSQVRQLMPNAHSVNKSFNVAREMFQTHHPGLCCRMNALHVAAAHGFVDVVRVLLTSPHLDVNKYTDKKEPKKEFYPLNGGTQREVICNSFIHKTALHLAVEGHHPEVVIALLEDPRVDVNLMTQEKWKVNRPVQKVHEKYLTQRSPLHLAALQGDVAMMQLFLRHPRIKPMDYATEDLWRKTGYEESSHAQNNCLRLYERRTRLWRREADRFPTPPSFHPCPPRSQEQGPIHYAAQCNSVEAVQLLLAAQPNDLNLIGYYQSELASYSMQEDLGRPMWEVVNSSFGLKPDMTPLLAAIKATNGRHDHPAPQGGGCSAPRGGVDVPVLDLIAISPGGWMLGRQGSVDVIRYLLSQPSTNVEARTHDNKTAQNLLNEAGLPTEVHKGLSEILSRATSRSRGVTPIGPSGNNLAVTVVKVATPIPVVVPFAATPAATPAPSGPSPLLPAPAAPAPAPAARPLIDLSGHPSPFMTGPTPAPAAPAKPFTLDVSFFSVGPSRAAPAAPAAPAAAPLLDLFGAPAAAPPAPAVAQSPALSAPATASPPAAARPVQHDDLEALFSSRLSGFGAAPAAPASPAVVAPAPVPSPAASESDPSRMIKTILALVPTVPGLDSLATLFLNGSHSPVAVFKAVFETMSSPRLRVTVVRGQNLMRSAFAQVCDPYTRVTISHQRFMTSTKTACCDPLTSRFLLPESFVFEMRPTFRQMTVEVFDKDRVKITREVPLGFSTVDLSSVLRELTEGQLSREFEGSATITPVASPLMGTKYYTNPVGLTRRPASSLGMSGTATARAVAPATYTKVAKRTVNTLYGTLELAFSLGDQPAPLPSSPAPNVDIQRVLFIVCMPQYHVYYIADATPLQFMAWYHRFLHWTKGELVLYYSRHIPDQEGDEADGQDEALVFCNEGGRNQGGKRIQGAKPEKGITESRPTRMLLL
ncbi:hypothetical protein PAPYR_5047 [Paratrimastix pyriformis]|uniref:C2 domain-containing protein n=1 Tax=Paratrimastix pyriformis TaxID=342808 RepID=A0ABQ8UQL4_9EUKA|nr:hypothetical protein PAPYR_5047 [Paratrimastix pyriformis]